jgi:apolipoprotein N-acyltransferase
VRAAADGGLRARGARWQALALRRPALTAFGCGALATLTLPPVHLWPLLLAFAPLVYLVRQTPSIRGAFVLGWAFGFGHFLSGLYWVGIAFFAEAERYGLLAVPAVLLLAAGMALFPALATSATAAARCRSVVASALVLALAWVAAELLRSHLFGGFPWNLIGYAWIETPVAQHAAVVGVYGLGLAGVALAAVFAVLLEARGRARWPAPLAATLVVALAWGAGLVRLGGAEAGEVEGVKLRLVQGNVAQHHKWQDNLRELWFQRHLDLSAERAEGVTHVIWPESATPYLLDRDEAARQRIAEVVPPGGLLITGGERFDFDSDPGRAWNSLFVLDGEGAIGARYDKSHLVPFGEFLPLRDILGHIGLGTLTRGSIDFQPGPGAVTLDVPGLPPFSPLICYEVIFPGDVVDAAARPAWLLNVTNDGWFGTSSGPYQHLAMAQMRAIEDGLPLVRAANTGISAVIDPWGRVLVRLELNRTGVIDTALPQPLEATVFARRGHLSLAVMAVLLVLVATALEARVRVAASKG